jgi:hypothetical protein
MLSVLPILAVRLHIARRPAHWQTDNQIAAGFDWTAWDNIADDCGVCDYLPASEE